MRIIRNFFWQKKVHLSTWSPLATAFNSQPTVKNGFRIRNKVGLFDIPELSSSYGFDELKHQCIADAENFIEEATSEKRSRKIVEIFDDLSNTLCKVADLAEFIRLAHPSEDFKTAAESACSAISGVVEKLNTNKKLCEALRQVVNHGDIVPTTEVDDRVAKLFLFDFEQSGIHLPDHIGNKVVALNNSILLLGQQFVAGASHPRAVHKKDVPKELQVAFPSQDNITYISGINANSTNPLLREFAYRIYLHPDEEQNNVLNRLLEHRNQLAVTCGFKTYAHRALRGCMIETPAIAKEFLDILSSKLKSRAEMDFNIMADMKKRDKLNSSLAAWDVPYYTKKYKMEKLQVTSADYAPYFSIGTCMEGLNILLSSLYGVHFETQQLQDGECWSEDVHKLAVIHESEGLLGYIYCDLYERENKPGQDCHFTIRGGKLLSNGKYQVPIVVLMLNLPAPRWSTPTLLTPGMVDNLFHEMGHAMHSMLGRTHYQHVAGTRCATDFAEVPSVLMEYFVRDPRVLRTFAKHFQTQEPLPENLLQKLCVAKDIFNASEMQIQLFYSALDHTYHVTHPLTGTTTQVLAEIQDKYYGLPYVKNTAWQLRFAHLVGYGAKYYSYLVSTALASSIWQSYFADDPFSRVQGERLRNECLAHGGGKRPWKLIADYLNKEPAPSLLVDSLVNDLDNKRNQLEYVAKTHQN